MDQLIRTLASTRRPPLVRQRAAARRPGR